MAGRIYVCTQLPIGRGLESCPARGMTASVPDPVILCARLSHRSLTWRTMHQQHKQCASPLTDRKQAEKRPRLFEIEDSGYVQVGPRPAPIEVTGVSIPVGTLGGVLLSVWTAGLLITPVSNCRHFRKCLNTSKKTGLLTYSAIGSGWKHHVECPQLLSVVKSPEMVSNLRLL